MKNKIAMTIIGLSAGLAASLAQAQTTQPSPQQNQQGQYQGGGGQGGGYQGGGGQGGGGQGGGGQRQFRQQFQQQDQTGQFQGGGRRNRGGFGGQGGQGGFGGQGGGFGGQGGFGGFNRNGSFSPTTSQADATPTPPPITGNYQILMNRSIFFAGIYRPPGSDQGQQQLNQPAPEDSLIFVGAMETFSNGVNNMMGFILDNDSQAVSQVTPGQTLASGKVIAISLDQMDFQSHGITQHLLVGQNLTGAQIFGANAAATTNLPITLDLNGPNGDMLKLLAQRRLKELNGGGK